MKTRKQFFGLIAIAIISTAIIVLPLAGCKDEPEPQPVPDPTPTFTSVANFKAWLDAQPANTAATTYHVKLNVSDLGGNNETAGSLGNALYTNPTKYVSLNLSGSTLASFANGAFYHCTSLTSITIWNGTTHTGMATFNGCTSLTSVTIPSSITSLGYNLFYGCTSLTSVTIPSSITALGDGAFGNCTSLTSVRFEKADLTFSSTGEDPSFIDVTNSASLKTAYTGGGIGTYTRPNTTSTTWTKS